MQTNNRLFDDLAKVAAGAFSTVSGVREEIETRFRERFERIAAELDLVTREELDAVRAVAVKARTEQEDLTARVRSLEIRLAELTAGRPEASASPDTGAAPLGEPPADDTAPDR